MIDRDMKIVAWPNLGTNLIDVMFSGHRGPNWSERYVGKPIVFETVPEGHFIGPPTLQLEDQHAQRLMDELWKCGIRPTEGAGSAGSLAATERHLADMRCIAFKFMDIEPDDGDRRRANRS